MERVDALRLFRIAHDEIIRLRRLVAEFEPKAHAYDTLARFSRLNEQRENSYAAPDVAYELSRAVDTLVAEREIEKDA